MAEDSPLTLANLNDLAVLHHEMFLSYMKAGFTAEQALELLKAWIPKPGASE